ncbi:unnamed protein product [Victoria cruziana]
MVFVYEPSFFSSSSSSPLACCNFIPFFTLSSSHIPTAILILTGAVVEDCMCHLPLESKDWSFPFKVPFIPSFLLFFSCVSLVVFCRCSSSMVQEERQG